MISRKLGSWFGRIAPRRLGQTVLMLIVCWPAAVVAQVDSAQTLEWLCKLDSVVARGVESSSEAIKPGDSVTYRFQVPPAGTTPSFEGDLTNGGRGAFWDNFGVQASLRWRAAIGVSANFGSANGTRVIIEDSDVDDAMGLDSVGYNLSIENIAIERGGAGLRDGTGQNLGTHLDWPDFETVVVSDWPQGDCFVEGLLDSQLFLATGKVEVIAIEHELPKTFTVRVQRGDVAAFIAAIEYAIRKSAEQITYIEFVGEGDFVFTGPYVEPDLTVTSSAIPPITGGFINFTNGATFRRDEGAGRFRFAVIDGGILGIVADEDVSAENSKFEVSGFSSAGNGGAVLVLDGELLAADVNFEGNDTDEGGGAVAIFGTGSAAIYNSSFNGNSSILDGSAILRNGTGRLQIGYTGGEGSSFENNLGGGFGAPVAVFGGGSTPDSRRPPVFINASKFLNNRSEEGGEACGVSIDVVGTGSTDDVEITNSYFSGSCDTPKIFTEAGRLRLAGNTVDTNVDVPSLKTGGVARMFGNVFSELANPAPQAARSAPPKTAAQCEITGGGSISSLGYNVSSGDGCFLDQPSDLPNTNPLLGPKNDSGYPVPMAGSPVIDIVPADMITFEGDSEPSLPCGWSTPDGLGSPQDGDGDGVVKCDAGAVEAPGGGEIRAAHSAAFYNSLRSGEGQYVEILGGGLAVIYTFTYTPTGDGPAWFTAVANINGNSLVSSKVQQPVGTAFGDGFDPNEIEYRRWGGMSMAFPGCGALDPPGSVAYSGNPEEGFQPLLTRAEQITQIVPCDESTTPHPNAGLSGAYFDSARSGEGVVVQWLPDGTVVVIMYTYGPNGEQMWIFGSAKASGNTVTIDALYPTGFTAWGDGFDASQVMLSPWGTFTLTWNDCNTLTYEYASNVEGYGSATRNYQRITQLSGVDCPVF